MSVPLHVVGDRPFIDLTLGTQKGPGVRARFLVDSGGGGFLLTEQLAERLGLTWGETIPNQGEELARVNERVLASIDDFALTLDEERVMVVAGKDNIVSPAAGGQADGLLPGHVLTQYHVVFDYPEETFTIARPGVLVARGERLYMPVSMQMGFPRTEVVVEGEALGLLLDTGASYTMISEVVLTRLASVHPDWERHEGAYGDATTLGGQTHETLLIPSATWAGFRLPDFGVVSQREGTFERWMSSMMTSPIVGSLAGNALKHFRVELDYVGEALYLGR